MACPYTQATGPDEGLEPDLQLQAGLFSGRAGYEMGKSICLVFNSRALFFVLLLLPGQYCFL